jgi:hypothetical protein
MSGKYFTQGRDDEPKRNKQFDMYLFIFIFIYLFKLQMGFYPVTVILQ